jgi:hypothetical protein
MRRLVVVLLAIVGLLAACSAPTSVPSVRPRSSAGASQSANSGPLGTLMATGFGQQGIYVWMTAIVRNNTPQVGQTVTVNFLVRDATGRRLAMRTEVESFSQPGVDHIVGTQVEVQAGEVVTKVEATLVIEDEGAFSATPFPPMPVTTPVVANGDSNSKVASFELTNPQSVPLQKPRMASRASMWRERSSVAVSRIQSLFRRGQL